MPARDTAPNAPRAQLVTVYSQPARANVWRHGRFVGVTPLPLEVPPGRALRVQVSLQGYVSQTLDLAPGESARVVKLHRARSESQALTQDERSRGKRRVQRGPRGAKPDDSYEKF
jgi:hypothetical protein